jgi:hypothetical protein
MCVYVCACMCVHVCVCVYSLLALARGLQEDDPLSILEAELAGMRKDVRDATEVRGQVHRAGLRVRHPSLGRELGHLLGWLLGAGRIACAWQRRASRAARSLRRHTDTVLHSSVSPPYILRCVSSLLVQGASSSAPPTPKVGSMLRTAVFRQATLVPITRVDENV